MSPPRSDAPRQRPLFGRSEVVEEVERALDEVGTSRGKALLLVGGGGSGKTVVLGEAAARAEARGFVPVRGRALPGELAEPFRIVRDLSVAAGGGEEHGGDDVLLPRAAGRATEGAAAHTAEANAAEKHAEIRKRIARAREHMSRK